MKFTKHIQTALVASASILLASGLSAQIFSEDFQSGYTIGSLEGQEGWTRGPGGTGLVIHSVQESNGNFFMQSQQDDSRAVLNAGNFGLTQSDSITLTFDLFVSESGSHLSFGIGIFDTDSTTIGNAPHFGLQNGNWIVRGPGLVSANPTINARAPNGSALSATLNNWYRVQSIWDLSGEGSATLSIMNLTAGETEFTQLFFDAAQTQTVASLSLESSNYNVSNWDGVWVRGRNNGLADNLVVVPEPATYVMLLGLFTGIFVAYRRLRLR